MKNLFALLINVAYMVGLSLVPQGLEYPPWLVSKEKAW